MKILLLSDSHGNMENMCQALEAVNPDMILHMGDCRKDALRLHAWYPEIPMESVVGNCDWSYEPAELLLDLEGFQVMICHGHQYGVKGSTAALEEAARENGADIVIFGHTHRVYYEYQPDLTIINPGSIGCPPSGIPASYGVLTLDGKKGSLHLDTFYLDQ